MAVSAQWEQVLASGLSRPSARSLAELPGELGDMLGDPDPAVRERVALPVLTTWVACGEYDDLLRRLGNGLVDYLDEGLGEVGTDSVFKRCASALVLAEVIEHDTRHALLAPQVVRGWGDRLVGWWLAERDLRGHVQGHGWARAAGAGAVAIGALGRSPHLGARGLQFVLDALADRLLAPTPELFVAGEPDLLAQATVDIVRRDLVDAEWLAPWAGRLGERAQPHADDLLHPMRVNGNVQAYLRALYLQLVLGPERFDTRADLTLLVVEQLIATNAGLRVRGSHALDSVLPRP